ncbi:MAG: hypothetical protein AAB793_01455 [Patescibacteria group bacterium]
MQKKIGGSKQLLVLDFNSMEELMEYAENASHNEREKGIVGVCFIERRVLEKAAHLIERKAKKQHERQIALSDERSLSSIMEMFLR